MTHLADLSLRDVSNGFRTKRFSASELLEQCLQRMSSSSNRRSAFLQVLNESARKAAQQTDTRIKNESLLGPLDGVPIAIKDNIGIKGYPTTVGFQFWRDSITEEDAQVITLLQTAGAVLVGKTNLDEAALGATTDNAFFGCTYNPYGKHMTPGGSSGGSSAAVAGRLCVGALGTDTMGSIRIPASYCGVVGLKPTYGRISTRGIFPLSRHLDHVGPFGRTVEDVQIMLSMLEGFDPRHPDSRRNPNTSVEPFNVKGLRLGTIENFRQTEWHPDVSASFEASLKRMNDFGCSVKPLEIPDYEPASTRIACLKLVEAEAASTFSNELLTRSNQIPNKIRKLLNYGARIESKQLKQLKSRLLDLSNRANALFDQVDALISPTTPQPAFPFETKVPINQADITVLANIANWPAISVPMGFDGIGMPLGIQFMAPAWRDATIIELARSFEFSRGPLPGPADYPSSI